METIEEAKEKVGELIRIIERMQGGDGSSTIKEEVNLVTDMRKLKRVINAYISSSWAA